MAKNKTSSTAVCCAFCGAQKSEVQSLLKSETSETYICDGCIDIGYDFLHKKPVASAIENIQKFDIKTNTPETLKEHLDQYVIGQDDAKEVLSVALYNHYKRIYNPVVDGTELQKSNVLLLGASGTGKTLLITTLAKKLELPIAMVDATSFTEAGYIGDDVTTMLEKLLVSAKGDVKLAEQGIIYIDEIDKKTKKSESDSKRDPAGEGVQQALLKLVEGTTVTVQYSPRPGVKEYKEINTKDILFIAGGAFVGIHEIVGRRRRGATNIGFGAPMPANENVNKEITVEDMIDYGMIPEFMGRFPIIVGLSELNEDMLYRIMKEPKNNILDQYRSLFKLDDVELIFEDDYVRHVAKESISKKIGARGLRSTIENVLLKTQFTLPTLAKNGLRKITVSARGIEMENRIE